MNIFTTLKLAFRALWRNKVRSVLTMLGIIFGIGTVIAMISAFGILLTEAMSHSAVVALLMPVSLGIAQQFGIDPRIMAPAVALPSGLAFTLPVGTPGNAIAYSSGYLNLRDMLIPGAVLVVVAWAAFVLTAMYYWPLIGLSLTPGG